MPDASAPAERPPQDASVAASPVLLRRLLAYLAAAQIAGGAASHEAEVDVVMAARGLGAESPQVRADPNGVWVSLSPGEPATFEAVEGGLRLDQSLIVARVQNGLSRGTMSAEEGLALLTALRGQKHRSPVLGMYAGGLIVSIGIATLLQPTWHSVLFSAAVSPIVVALIRLTGRRILPAALLPLVASFLVALPAFWLWGQGWLESPLRSSLPALAVLLPGGLIVTGLSELVAGRMVAGSSRLIYGSTQLVLFAVGIAAAAHLLHSPQDALNNVRVDELGPAVGVVGMVLLTAGIVMQESVPWRVGAVVLVIVMATFLAQLLSQVAFGAVWAGGFIGALTASFLSWAIAATHPEWPRLVLFLPSFWLLVPGSLGLVSVAQLGADPSSAFSTFSVTTTSVISIAMGLIIGTSLARQLGRAVRAARKAS